MDDYLTKPIDPVELGAALSRWASPRPLKGMPAR
jgi:CheY-like chemotaxis protein